MPCQPRSAAWGGSKGTTVMMMAPLPLCGLADGTYRGPAVGIRADQDWLVVANVDVGLDAMAAVVLDLTQWMNAVVDQHWRGRRLHGSKPPDNVDAKASTRNSPMAAGFMRR